MNTFKNYTIIFLLLAFSCKHRPEKIVLGISSITYQEEVYKFTAVQKQLIQNLITDSEKEIRTLLPALPTAIQVAVETVDWDIDAVGGVTGRTETNTPPFVIIQISNKFPGGPTNAIQSALELVISHEFHHLYRGWAIKDNTFDHGIDIAAVNEGLAVVFSEEFTHKTLEADNAPEDAIAHAWAKEILALPKEANYREWMFQHPDGRQAIEQEIL